MTSSPRFGSLRRSTWLRLTVLGVIMMTAAALSAFSASAQTTTPTCTTNSDCPATQLCCQEFGYFGSPKICKDPVHGHCPLVP
jgi:hypothetical protein